MADYNQVSISIDDDDILHGAGSDTEEVTSRPDEFSVFRNNGMVKIGEDDLEFGLIKKNFLFGIAPGTGNDTSVVAVHKNTPRGFTSKARSASFRFSLEAVKRKCGGEANLKFGWIGGSLEKLIGIITHGFSGCEGDSEDFVGASGVGVKLSPSKFVSDAVIQSDTDANGLKHVLICRVILGKSEVVPAGSKQFRPSSTEFDSGVDNFFSPRKYIIWNSLMNSQILPSYIVSFKPPIQKVQVIPQSPWLSFNALLSVLSSYLSPYKLNLISNSHKDYKGNKISRVHMVQKLRLIAGDELLQLAIKQFREKRARQLQLQFRRAG